MVFALHGKRVDRGGSIRCIKYIYQYKNKPEPAQGHTNENGMTGILNATLTAALNGISPSLEIIHINIPSMLQAILLNLDTGTGMLFRIFTKGIKTERGTKLC